MHELTIFAALGDREPCVRTSDVSDDASAAQSISSFSPSVPAKLSQWPASTTDRALRRSPAPCTADAGQKRRSVPERDREASLSPKAARPGFGSDDNSAATPGHRRFLPSTEIDGMPDPICLFGSSPVELHREHSP